MSTTYLTYAHWPTQPNPISSHVISSRLTNKLTLLHPYLFTYLPNLPWLMTCISSWLYVPKNKCYIRQPRTNCCESELYLATPSSPQPHIHTYIHPLPARLISLPDCSSVCTVTLVVVCLHVADRDYPNIFDRLHGHVQPLPLQGKWLRWMRRGRLRSCLNKMSRRRICQGVADVHLQEGGGGSGCRYWGVPR